MGTRLLILACCFAASSAYVHHAMQPERVPLRQPFATMDRQVGRWTGREQVKLADNILTVLGVDDYVNRIYQAAPNDLVSLYIGYYQSQRDGDSIHSPMNCLPGAGWEPMSTSYASVVIPGRSEPITVKRVLIQKGVDRQLVLYWYQSHGRIVANEYTSKALMVYDAVRLHRSDAALVRVVTPIDLNGSEAQADARAREFVETLVPQLSKYLPS